MRVDTRDTGLASNLTVAHYVNMWSRKKEKKNPAFLFRYIRAFIIFFLPVFPYKLLLTLRRGAAQCSLPGDTAGLLPYMGKHLD